MSSIIEVELWTQSECKESFMIQDSYKISQK